MLFCNTCDYLRYLYHVCGPPGRREDEVLGGGGLLLGTWERVSPLIPLLSPALR